MSIRWPTGCAFAGVLLAAVGVASAQPETETEYEPEHETERLSSEDDEPLADVGALCEEAEIARAAEFARTVYEFCHEEDYDPRLTPNGLTFCEIYDDTSLEVCPMAKRSCVMSRPWWTKLSFTLPAPYAWTLLALGIAVLLVGFFYALRKAGWEGSHDLDLDDDDDALDTDALQRLPDTPSQVILRRAERALEAGNAVGAAILTQLAMLRYMDDTAMAPFHPSRTNGDYLRAIRRYRPHRDLYRSVAYQTDRVRFGDGGVDEAQVRANLKAAQTLLSRPPPEPPGPGTSRAGAQVAAGTLLLAVLGTSCGDCMGAFRPFYSHAPGGMAALPALLRRVGVDVTIRRDEIDQLPAETTVAVIRTSAGGLSGLADVSVDGLLDRGVTVVVIDDFDRAAHFLPVTLTSTHAESKPRALEAVLPGEVLCDVDFPAIAEQIAPDQVKVPFGPLMRWSRTKRRAPASSYTFEHAPLLVPPSSTDPDADPEVLAFAASRVSHDDEVIPGCLLVFSTDQLFTNGSLTRTANAKFVAAFFGSLVGPSGQVVLLDALEAGSAEDSSLRSMGEARLLPFVLQAGLCVAALFLSLGAAFGPLRDPVVVEHKGFVEHVEAVGQHYHAAGKAGLSHAARSLARLLVTRHHRQVRGGRGWLALARHLADKHGLAESDVQAALRLGIEGTSELGAPGPNDPVPSSEQMLTTLSTLVGRRGPQGPAR